MPAQSLHLGSYIEEKNHYDGFRDLTRAEVDQHKAFTLSIIEARSRLSLFRMLERNYTEWRNNLNRLLSPDRPREQDDLEELDRLLLNYLTCAYTIQEHFAVSFHQRHKKQPAIMKEYSAFIERLCSACWSFAFFMDYRGYVQHVGLGISRYIRKQTDTSVSIEIKVSSKSLAANSRNWKRSSLTIHNGELDLVALLKEFHVQMFQSYAPFVVKTFFPELKPAEQFYARLTKEVQDRHPNSRMVFFRGKPQYTVINEGKMSINMQILSVPNALLDELGITVTRT